MDGDFSHIGSTAKGLGDGIEAGARGIDRLVARLEDVSGHALAPAKELLSGPLARRRAKSAVSIFEASGATLAEADRRAIAYSAMRGLKGFENVQETLALVDIGDGAPMDEVEDEWLSLFLDCAESAFSEWKRKFLAGAVSAKAKSPHDIPLGSLHAIARMEHRDMDAFEAVCSVRLDEPHLEGVPVILCLEDDLLSLIGLDSESVMRLCDVGVLRRAPSRIRKSVVTEEWLSQQGIEPDARRQHPIAQKEDYSMEAAVRFSTRTVVIPPMRLHVSTYMGWETDVLMDFGEFEFTEAGKGLAAIADVETAGCVEEYMVKGYEVVSAREERELSDGPFAKRDFERTVREIVNRDIGW